MSREKEPHGLKFWHRWLDISFLIFIVLVICYVFNPFLNYLGAKLDEIFLRTPRWIYWSVNALCTVPVCFMLIRLAGFRIRDLWRITSLRFPPLWIATLIGAFLYFLLEPLPGIIAGPEDFVSKLPYVLIGIAPIVPGIIIAGFLNYLSSTYKNPYGFAKRTSNFSSSIAPLQSLIEDPDALLKWLHQEVPIQIPEEDLFDFSVVARRIARLLQETPLKTIGLVGPYGCGKSSILYLIEYDLHHSQENDGKALFNPKDIIISKTSGWGFKEGAAAESILHAIIQDLSKQVDCLGLVSVPAQYRSALSNTGYAWSKILASLLQPSHNPLELLKKIDDLLICIRKRVVIFLEDLDRNLEDKVFWNEILSLLDRLKDLKNISFVLAIGQDPKTAGVLMRVAEHIEAIPTMPRRDMIDLLNFFRNFCLEKFPEDIDLLSKEEREDSLGIRPPQADYIAELMDVNLVYPIDAMAKILINPRLTKTALRRVWQAWQSLHGEIDFDDLFMVNILRTSAPEAFAFINGNIARLRNLSGNSYGQQQEKQKKREEVKKILSSYISETDLDNESVETLINTLFPTSLKSEFLSPRKVQLQGVARLDHTDYWRRLNKEEISREEIHDQYVIRALTNWKQKGGEEISKNKGLVKNILEVEGFADKVEQFGLLLNGNDVRSLAKNLFQSICSKKESKKRGEEYPGFFQLWRLSLDKPVAGHEEWLVKEISKALPVSLLFSRDLYYYWRNIDRSMHSEKATTPELQNKVIANAKKIYSGNSDMLIKALNIEDMYSTKSFFIYFSGGDGGGAGYTPDDWRWFAGGLLEEGEKNSHEVVPQIAGLVVDSEIMPLEKERKYFHKFNIERAQNFFQEDLSLAMRLLAKEIDVSTFSLENKETIQFAQEEAKKWLVTKMGE